MCYFAQTLVLKYSTRLRRTPRRPHVLPENGKVEAGFVDAGLVGCGARIAPALVAPGAMGPSDKGTMGVPWTYWAHGPMANRAKGPWAFRAHGPWALRAQGWALWARWAFRAQLSPCRYAEDDFFAPYMRSKVCPILVAP